MDIFLSSGIILLLGLGFAKLLEKIKFPAVTSYLLIGILIGPYGFKLIPASLINSTDFMGYFVLGIVAFLLGENFFWKQFVHVGREVIAISIGEVLGAFVLVLSGLLLTGMPLYEALIFAGLAPASAPMAIYMVVRELKAKGKFTETLLDILAIDDAWGIILFVIAMAISKILLSGESAEVYFSQALFKAGNEIFGAIISGGLLALIFFYFTHFIVTERNMLVFTLGFVLIATGISLRFKFSPLLTNMALGTGVANFTKTKRSFEALRRIDWPLYLLFFVLCGSAVKIPLLKNLSLVGSVYIVSRLLGLYLGANIAGAISHSDANMRKYIGLGLFAQAGVALGLAIIAKVEFPKIGDFIFTTIIATTIVFEIIGPLTARFAISRVGESGK